MSDQGSSGATWSPPSTENTRYYCHTCEAEFDNAVHRNDEVLCQNCNNGFIEIIESRMPDPSAFNASSQGSDDEDRQFLASVIQEVFQRGLGLPVQVGPRDPRLRPRHGTDAHRISTIITDLMEDGTNQPLFFVGNPGDYAWGREGLDAIVTQLLNQMDGSGPPPLPTDKIKQIPVAHITKAQIDSKLQCSVCWELFSLDESVRRLPCDHFYHTPCIEPWLQLHGTCPICRQALHSTGGTEASGDGRLSSSASGSFASSLGLLTSASGSEGGGAGSLASSLALLTSAAGTDAIASGLAESLAAGGGGLNIASIGNFASALLGGSRPPPPPRSNNPSAPTSDSGSTPNSSNPNGDNNSSSGNPAGRRFFDMDFD